MNKKMSVLACSAAFVAMGMGMPQCPGQSAMQQQIDTLQQSQSAMTTKLTMVASQTKTMTDDMAQTKQLITQLSQAVTAQTETLKQQDAVIKDLQAKLVAKPAAAKGKKRK